MIEFIILDKSSGVILKPFIVNCPKDLYSVAVIPLLEFVCPYFYQVSSSDTWLKNMVFKTFHHTTYTQNKFETLPCHFFICNLEHVVFKSLIYINVTADTAKVD